MRMSEDPTVLLENTPGDEPPISQRVPLSFSHA